MWNGMSADRFVRLPPDWYSRFEWNDIDALNHEVWRVKKRSFWFRLKHVVVPSRFKSRTFSRWLSRSDKILNGSNITHARRHTTRMQQQWLQTKANQRERERLVQLHAILSGDSDLVWLRLVVIHSFGAMSTLYCCHHRGTPPTNTSFSNARTTCFFPRSALVLFLFSYSAFVLINCHKI